MSNSHGEATNFRGAMSNFRGEAPGDRGEATNFCGAMSNFRGEAPGNRGEATNFCREAPGNRGEPLFCGLACGHIAAAQENQRVFTCQVGAEGVHGVAPSQDVALLLQLTDAHDGLHVFSFHIVCLLFDDYFFTIYLYRCHAASAWR